MPRLEVTTSDGKYTVIQEAMGGMRFLRYGKPWPVADRNFSHIGLILALAEEIDELRRTVHDGGK